MGRENNIYGVSAAVITVGIGASLARLIEPVPGECASVIKYFTGGSLEIIGAPPGTTYAGATVTALAGTGYLFGTAEAMNIDGAGRYYLIATGATAQCYLLRGLSQGY